MKDEEKQTGEKPVEITGEGYLTGLDGLRVRVKMSGKGIYRPPPDSQETEPHGERSED